MTTEPEDRTKFRLLDLLEGELLPKKRHSRAKYRPPALPSTITDAVWMPSWNWTYKGPDARTRRKQPVVFVDANAAYLSAASSVLVAFDTLTRTGPLERYPRLPGYYRIRIERGAWQDSRWCSPLGEAPYREVIWIAEPTMTLLSERVRDDEWPDIEIVDSLTSTETCRLSDWTNRLRDMRAVLLDDGDRQAYDVFKIAYSQAVQMMQGSDKCAMRRPDWAHAIRSQHRANFWRKVWTCAKAGHGPIASGRVDGLVFTEPDLDAIKKLELLRFDESGKAFGTFKKVDPDTEPEGC